jgi:hypothetical protein
LRQILVAPDESALLPQPLLQLINRNVARNRVTD